MINDKVGPANLGAIKEASLFFSLPWRRTSPLAVYSRADLLVILLGFGSPYGSYAGLGIECLISLGPYGLVCGGVFLIVR